MDFPLTNNYIQYLTKKGIVKTKSVTFTKNYYETTFEVSGINEDFFILSVFENNVKKSGIAFQNIDNVDMLGFINSNFFDINLIPDNSFFPSEQIVVLTYNQEYLRTATEYVNALHPDHVYLLQFCEKNYPAKTFYIKPFYHGLDYLHQINNPNNNLLYFARVVGIVTSFVSVLDNIGLSNQESSLSMFYHSAGGSVASSTPFLFNRLVFSTGSNFAGITTPTPLSTYAQVMGYVAIFDEPVFVL